MYVWFINYSSMLIWIIKKIFYLWCILECKIHVKYYYLVQVIFLINNALLRVEMIWKKKSWIWIYNVCFANIKWCK